MRYLFFLTGALFFVSSCGTSRTYLTEEGKHVKVLGQRAPARCEVLNKVVGENDAGSEALAKNHARNLAAKDGGDAITFDQVVSNGKEYRIHATAYRCKN